MKILILAMLFITSTMAMAKDPIKLECRVDTVQGVSIPRQIVLQDGMIEDISCNIDSCKDKDLNIKMNYNSLYSQVSLSIWDLHADQAIETSYPNLKVGSRIEISIYKSKIKRFLNISCEVDQI